MMEVDTALSCAEWLRAMRKFGTGIMGSMKPTREILYPGKEGYEYAIKLEV
jgi:hypothetical protein